ncbi:hypothetical protein A3C21_00045 [Candidatus Kaiserbacteria bacterium RIFCSPHIGHO2_02_FULL_59_21]|nr:MAG: hypothetical protein A3C21_00045 [Candidatus Kaiserbacteria bacterium RIFCSPHIGHO2_02_FULL_59_21]OGG80110.1 MAG: hypothetical protein A2952_03420 [Candidatus Kaiserbacteria bacterium RIFCSPLOWO2_01_FULL_59_34]
MILCPWEPSVYVFFSENVPPLVHYSHLIAIVAAVTIGLYVFFGDPKAVVSRLFLLMVGFFSTWTILDVILWATNRPDVVMFSWSLQILFEPLTYGVAFYMFYYFLHNAWPSFRTNVLVALLLLPIVSFLHTEVNLQELYLSSCEAAEGFLAAYYTHIVNGTLILTVAIMAAREMPKRATRRERFITFFFAFGLITFLLAFSSGTIIGSLTEDWIPSQYGLFGMPVFATFIAYSIARFNAFNAKVLTTELLVVALAIAVVSLVALQEIQNVRIVAAITFLLVCVMGYVLIKNVKKEIQQRQLIEKQEKELEIVNQQQESLLHFISHEIKGYLTESQAGFASIVEGDFGAVPEAVRTMSAKALSSVRRGVATVMDILDASNLKKGTVAYAKKKFDFRTAIREIVRELKPTADEKRLAIELRIGEGAFLFEGDEDKIRRHVLRNLIDNAIRYTPSGSVKVGLSDGAVIRFSVEDSGVGIATDDMPKLFTAGGHGKDSIKVNVHSTGYGLFIAKQVVEAHGGRIWAESKGEGKGSIFIVEFTAR